MSTNLDLSPATLMAEAAAKENLNDFGADDFKIGLARLTQTYAETGWNEKGLKVKRRRVVDLLAKRLLIEQAYKDYPQIKAEKITRPLYLTGLPRTGTSALLNLLANDPANRPMKLWEGMNPDPCKDYAPGKPDPRYMQMKQWEEHQKASNPEFAKIHSTGADTPEECIHLLNHTFQDPQFGIELMLEPYASYFQQLDLLPSYRYYADLLRMLQWQRPGAGDHWRWLLKAPSHLWGLDAIASIAPDACIIITHRNVLEAVGSYCSMMSVMMKEREFDKAELGATVLEYLARSMERAMQLRQNMPAASVLDVSYGDFINDGVNTARRIYSHFSLPFTPTIEGAMQAHVAAHPINKHGKHSYGLEEFGLREEQVQERMRFYTQAYADYLQ